MTEIRRILSEAGPVLAETMPVWRDAAVAVLAIIVIGCLWFYAAAVDV